MQRKRCARGGTTSRHKVPLAKRKRCVRFCDIAVGLLNSHHLSSEHSDRLQLPISGWVGKSTSGRPNLAHATRMSQNRLTYP